MKYAISALALALSTIPATAAVLDCDELIETIAKRLDSKHVSDYELSAVPVKESHAGKEVGRCEKGAKKVMLERDVSKHKAPEDDRT